MDKPIKNVLVTGSDGYIGSVLVPLLQEEGYNVACYDTGFFRNCHLYEGKTYESVNGDMRQLDFSVLDNIDAVVHLAGISNDPFGDLMPEEVYDSSVVYSVELAKACKSRGVKYVFASSCSIYGKGGDGLVDEDSPVDPLTPYSVNKVQIEEQVGALSDDSFCPVFLRFSTLYGLSPRLRFDIVVNMLAGMAVANSQITLNSDGVAWRPFLHINDACQALIEGILYNGKGGKPLIVNVGSTEENYQIIQIAKMIENKVPGCDIKFMNLNADSEGANELIKDRKVQDGHDKRSYQVSFEKIKKELPGFSCEWTVERGVESMINKFNELNLSSEDFTNIRYYRLQTMEDLYNSKKINSELYWIK